MSDQNPSPPARVFKIGATRITQSPEMAALSNEEVRQILKVTYPEVTHATVRETTLEDGTQLVEWLPVAGKKG